MRERLGLIARLGGVFAMMATIGLVAPHLAEGADHTDSPAAEAVPNGDIGDLYAWVSNDDANLNLITTVAPFAGAGATFDNTTQYQWHIASRAAFGDADAEEANVICQFYDAPMIECWVMANDGTTVLDYVEGDASAAAGITGTSGLRVYAGMRDDPFYMNLEGLTNAVAATVALVGGGGVTSDLGNCPTNIDAATTTMLVQALTSETGMTDGNAIDDLLDQNILAIVVQVPTAMVDDGGSLLAVWTSTHTAP